MAAPPGDREPGGRLYRVEVLIPMQELHWDLEKSICDLGVIFMLPIAAIVPVMAKDGSGSIFHAYLVMGLLLAVASGFRALIWRWDRKRGRLSDEHMRLVRKFGTREVQWSP